MTDTARGRGSTVTAAATLVQGALATGGLTCHRAAGQRSGVCGMNQSL